jgi:hypothetical protein
MTIQQLGGYLFDLGFILGFFHTQELTALAAFFTSLGIGLESGTASFPVKVGNAKAIGGYIADLGFIFAWFKFLAPAASFCTQLGTELAAGMGTFGPIRVGNEGISGSVASNGDGSDTITFTVAAWPA